MQKNLEDQIVKLAKQARAAGRAMALVSTAEKNQALKKMAAALKSRAGYLIAENQKDIRVGQARGLSSAMLDRLLLNEKRIEGMACSLREAAGLPDPVGEIMRQWKRPNGIEIKKVRVPIGVIGIIYEARPNVTSDCAALCLKSGNAVILKGGKEAFNSNRAIDAVLRQALKGTKIPANAIQLVQSTDREAVKILLQQNASIDLIVPRGGEGLIRFVAENSLIPVVKHYKGVCHTFVSATADLKMAEEICYNAKVQRPGVCNAMETLLVQEKIAARFLPVMAQRYWAAGVELRGCAKTRAILGKQVKSAAEDDWYAEYLDLILAVRVVKDVGVAIEHINKYGSNHSDAIVTRDKKEADRFLREVDSATVYINASTRFTDGYEFGFGAEIGISTDKIHARGPMALEELTTYKYQIYGKGQIRS
ncbi:MAG: glutamate-5-semialdehyde dehydrogenase [Candidatus Omnitrophica bacterium]|nr:glutamate-5-semialdehyde dehydrogenase [Candidatus Omnitrophota bacterium]